MSYDIEQEESLAAIKDWWKKHSTKVFYLILIAAIAMIGYRGYQYYLQKQAENAAALYEIVVDETSGLPVDGRLAAFNSLLTGYSQSVYLPRAAIALVGKMSATQPEQAIEVLQKTIQVNTDATLDGFLRLHLSHLFMQQKKYDEALQTLALRATDPDEVQALSYDKQGDIYWEKGSLPEAKKAYEEALLKWTQTGMPHIDFVQLKLDAVQGAM